MEGTWKIYQGDQAVGVCTVAREGLYYRITARCEGLTGRYRLFWGEEDLGLLVPEQGALTMQTRRSSKHFPAGEPHFSLKKKQEKGRFVPLSPKEPFSYLQELERAVFTRRDGQPGLLLR